MNNTFAEKPTRDEVGAYEKRLNYYLQAHRASVNIILLESPIVMCSINPTGPKVYEYYWVDSVVYTSPDANVEIGNLFSEYSFSKDKYFDEKLAWTDAACIQDEVYKIQGRFKEGFRVGNGDPYWKLWDLLPKS